MLVRPYGDTLDDGSVQLSFTLPVANGARAREDPCHHPNRTC